MTTHRTIMMSWRLFVLGIIAVSAVNPSRSTQSRSLTFETVDDVDTFSFDPAKISEEELRQLVFLSPFIVSYLNDLPGREFTTVGSTRGSAVDKAFVALPLELCVASDPAYSHCQENEISGPNFLRNAKANIEKSRSGLVQLQHLDYPKELQPVVKFLESSLELSLRIEETRLRYYYTWDEAILREIHVGIDSANLCPDTFRKLEAAGSKIEKYQIVKIEWGNCMIRAVDHKLGSYPIDSWNDFLKSYAITERYEAKSPD